jgi:hypothetical protein
MYFYVFSLYGYRCAGVAVQYRRQRFSTSAPVHRPVPCLLLLVSHFSLPLTGFLITVHGRAVFPLPSVTRCRKVMPFQDHPGHVWLQRNVQTEVNELRRCCRTLENMDAVRYSIPDQDPPRKFFPSKIA